MLRGVTAAQDTASLVTASLVMASLVAVGLVLSVAPDVSAATEAERTGAAIDGGIAYLKRKQKPNGTWTDPVEYPGGITALCTLALLSAGVEPSDPSIQRALDALRKFTPESTYVTALQTMAFCAAEPAKDQVRIGRNVRWLEANQVTTGENAGAWAYPKRGPGDNSNTQFAMLALYEAERVGANVNPTTWKRSLKYWVRSQNPDGSWSYINPTAFKDLGDRPGGLGSMTCAGITSLIIAAGQVGEADAAVEGDRVQCCGRPTKAKDEAYAAIQRGMKWMGGRFAVEHHPGMSELHGRGTSQRFHLYYLYGIERVGRLTSQRWIGEADWYRAGAKYLVERRDNLEGFWKSSEAPETNEEIATSFVLLFLAKGRRPVLVAKLQHGEGDDWNRHRHDLDHLTRYVEDKWKKDKVLRTDISWQVVSAEHATLDDLRQSPVLFISGKDGIPLSERLKKDLRAYVDQGGFIFAENCCEGSGFHNAFTKLMEEIFPDAKLMPLDDRTHPIWTADANLVPELPKFIGKHPIQVLHTGCRIGVVYTPKNLGCYWELTSRGREQDAKYPADVQAEIDFCRGLGANVLAYATNRELKFKYENFDAPPSDVPQAVDRGTIYVAKLAHAGGCDEAPLALPNLLKTAAAQLKIRVSAERRTIAITDKNLFDYHLVMMHGLRDFTLSEAERKQLRQYVERGGTVMADAINSSPQFAAAFRREMKAAFGKHPLEAIPADHPLIKPDAENKLDVYDITSVAFREPVAAGVGQTRSVKTTKIAARLEGISIDNRYGVIFSPYDISCALENHESLQFPGYSREDAKKVWLNVLLYSLRQ